MSSISIRFVFQETPCWAAHAEYMGKEGGMLGGIAIMNPRKTTKSVPKTGIQAAIDKLLDENFCNVTGNTFSEFRTNFIRAIQAKAVRRAAETGDIISPENYQSDFWSRKHILRLAAALRRARKKPSLAFVKLCMALEWEKSFSKLTAAQLASHFNSKFGTQFKARTLWQLAYRSDLFSKRTSGPPQREGR